jgi:hypothetical protein
MIECYYKRKTKLNLIYLYWIALSVLKMFFLEPRGPVKAISLSIVTTGGKQEKTGSVSKLN